MYTFCFCVKQISVDPTVFYDHLPGKLTISRLLIFSNWKKQGFLDYSFSEMYKFFSFKTQEDSNRRLSYVNFIGSCLFYPNIKVLYKLLNAKLFFANNVNYFREIRENCAFKVDFLKSILIRRAFVFFQFSMIKKLFFKKDKKPSQDLLAQS